MALSVCVPSTTQDRQLLYICSPYNYTEHPPQARYSPLQRLILNLIHNSNLAKVIKELVKFKMNI